MKRKIISIAVMLGLLVGLMVVPAQAATEDEIEQSILDGLAWLVAQQNTDPLHADFGSWTGYNSREAGTGLALYKLCERAYELNDPDIESPFDPDYEYSQNVIDGFNWVFAHLSVTDISVQDHTTGASGGMDDPDSNGNGKGVYTSGYQTYGTGILLAAIAASGTPSRPNEGAMDVDGDTYTDTYQEIAQDMVDFLAWGQVESPVPNITKEGGWDYSAVNNGLGGTGWKGDQSNSGYAVLGLAEAQAFGCTIPGWVKTELDWWIDWVQDDINDPVQTNDGGSWYSYPSDSIGVNILKTGNLIFQMALVGDAPDAQRVTDALDYLERHWGDASGANTPPGWDGDPAHYQAMFCAMKGLEYMGIDTFGDPAIDWFEDFSDAIVAEQIPQDDTDPTIRGSWQTSSGRGEPVIITEWALLTLERIAPPSPCPEEPGTRTLGFYKNHECVVELLLPQTVGDVTFATVEEAMELLWAKPRGDHRLILERALLVAKLNVAMFGIGQCDLLGIGDSVNDIIAQGEELLANEEATNDELSAIYELLDEINNYGTEVPLPEEIAEECPPGGGPPKPPPGKNK